MSTTTPVTAEQLAQMPDDGYRYELIEGEIVRMSPGSKLRGKVIRALFDLIAAHAEGVNVGETFPNDIGFLIHREPDTVRGPGVAFMLRERLEKDEPDETFWTIAPGLAVEVVSTHDTIKVLDKRFDEWLTAGTQWVWVVDPFKRTVTLHEAGGRIFVLMVNEELSGELVLPGFRCGVPELFVNL